MGNLTEISYHGFGFLDIDDLDRTAPERLSELYKAYIQRRPECVSWKFRIEVLKIAKVMFSNFTKWYELQKELNLGEYHQTFIEDTVRYVATGNRKFQHHTMLELIRDSEHNTVKRGVKRNHTKPMDIMSVKSTPELISRWCSHKNGFNDMLCTLYVLFGDPRENTSEHL